MTTETEMPYHKMVYYKKKALGRCQFCPQITIDGKTLCDKHYKENRVRVTAIYRRQKTRVYDHYGRTCKCCSAAYHQDFLHLDHINNDGGTYRKAGCRGGMLYGWIIRNKFPDYIQTLCSNCDSAKNVNGGV